MKNFKILVLTIGSLLGACTAENTETTADMIERGLDVARSQALFMAGELSGRDGTLPKTYEDGELVVTSYRDWVSGFFPGVLWYLYENYGTDNLKEYAELYTDRVEPAKNVTNTHDLGFMLYCSFGNGYRLTGNAHYLDVLETGARTLARRFNYTVGAMRSWDFLKEKWQFPVIIDNMMNLEFFSFIAKETGQPEYLDMARSHAAVTMEHHYRSDYSTYHVVSYDTITGLPHAKNTHQGYSDGSSWARGQSWSLCGFTMMYRETGDRVYLEHARNIARFIMEHPLLPEDKVPYWDFDAPDIPDALRDASAAAIMASALIELSRLDDSPAAPSYQAFAIDQLRSLSSPQYLAEPGTNGGFILKHSVGSLPGPHEVDVPLTYADYYYIEALLRLKDTLGV